MLKRHWLSLWHFQLYVTLNRLSILTLNVGYVFSYLAEGKILLHPAQTQHVARFRTHNFTEVFLQIFVEPINLGPGIEGYHILMLPVVLVLHKGQNPSNSVHHSNQLEFVYFLLEGDLHLMPQDMLVDVVRVQQFREHQQRIFVYFEIHSLDLPVRSWFVEFDLKILHIFFQFPLVPLRVHFLLTQQRADVPLLDL